MKKMRWEIKVDPKNYDTTIEGYSFEESGATINYISKCNCWELWAYNNGGEDVFQGTYHNLTEAIKEAESWT